jgi:MraZ protein
LGGERELYQGYALQAVDKKGRIAIPARLRDALFKNSTDRILMIGDEVGLPCLVAYDESWSHLLKARLEAEYDQARSRGEGIARARDALNSFVVDDVQFDEAGRFILPRYVIEDLGLTDFAFFAGAGDVFHIWNPHTLLNNSDVPEGTRKRCAFAMKEKGVAL